MELLPKTVRATLPTLYATENQDDPIVHCKFFAPWNSWTYYVLEFDGEDTLYGFATGFFPELGYASLSEIQSAVGPYGLTIERDLYFRPCNLSEVKRAVYEQQRSSEEADREHRA